MNFQTSERFSLFPSLQNKTPQTYQQKTPPKQKKAEHLGKYKAVRAC